MSYRIRELDPVTEISPRRQGVEFSIAFVVVFLIVRFGGWHHHMDPLGYEVRPPTWLAILIGIGAGLVFVVWRAWYAQHTAHSRHDHE